MNTLGYVARQFDVLASPKTPPSTPTADSSLPRVRSWSTKSLLFPHVYPKRSHSTPSFSSSPAAPTSTPSPPDLPSPSHTLEIVIDQVFFIRVLLLVWDNLKTAWSTLVSHFANPIHLDIIKGQEKNLEPPQLATDHPVTPLLSISAKSPTKKTPFHMPKTLVLDLDETLIHSTSRPMPAYSSGGSGILALGSFGTRNKSAGHMVEVVLAGRSTLYHVYKRPFVDFFLRTVSGWYTLVIFTASMQEYADPVIDWLDAGRGILSHRFFRDSCTQLPNGSYTKDLSLVEADLSRVCLVDNSPVSYTVNEANGIPIEGWTHDPSDEALLDLLPVLDSLRFTSDVRRVLGLRSAGVHRNS